MVSLLRCYRHRFQVRWHGRLCTYCLAMSSGTLSNKEGKTGMEEMFQTLFSVLVAWHLWSSSGNSEASSTSKASLASATKSHPFLPLKPPLPVGLAHCKVTLFPSISPSPMASLATFVSSSLLESIKPNPLGDPVSSLVAILVRIELSNDSLKISPVLSSNRPFTEFWMADFGSLWFQPDRSVLSLHFLQEFKALASSDEAHSINACPLDLSFGCWGTLIKSCFLKCFLECFFCLVVGKFNPKFCFTPSAFLPSSLLPLSSLQGRRVKEITHQPLPAALIQVLLASASALNLGVILLLILTPLLTNLISMASSNTSSLAILKDGFLTKSICATRAFLVSLFVFLLQFYCQTFFFKPVSAKAFSQSLADLKSM